MTDWFRSWHGAPTDPKWLLIGRKAGVAPVIVAGIAWALFDHASQQRDRGDVSRFDAETYAVFAGIEEEQVSAVVAAMTDKRIIENGRLRAWDDRQPRREDDSAARVKAFRERKGNDAKRDVTQRNAPDTDTEVDTEPKPIGFGLPEPNGSGPQPSEKTPEAELFERGKQVLGAKSGGQIKRLLMVKGGNIALARAAIEQASTKQNPSEYVGRILSGPGPPDPALAMEKYAL